MREHLDHLYSLNDYYHIDPALRLFLGQVTNAELTRDQRILLKPLYPLLFDTKRSRRLMHRRDAYLRHGYVQTVSEILFEASRIEYGDRFETIEATRDKALSLDIELFHAAARLVES